jgi:hypothetical protein
MHTFDDCAESHRVATPCAESAPNGWYVSREAVYFRRNIWILT